MLLVVYEEPRILAVGQKPLRQKTCWVVPVVAVHVRHEAGNKNPSL